MSLLLDALKKAEKAKEQARRGAEEERAGEAEAVAQGEQAGGEAGERAHVRTRNELPDISQPLEISDEDVTAREDPRDKPPALALELENPEPASEPAPPIRPAPRASESVAASATQAANRATAQRVFEAKFREPNPRMPFYIVLGVLGAFAVGTVIYFWYQLRPPPALVNAQPARPANERPVVAETMQAQGPQGAATPSTPAAAAIPGLPPEVSKPAPSAAPATVAQPAAAAAAPSTAAAAPPKPAEASVEKPRATPAAPRREPTARRRAEAEARPIRSQPRRAEPIVNPRVAAGYQAYQADDLAGARADYEQALRAEPMNRDALLGLAAVELKAHRYEQAESYYARLLQANPHDPNATAGMLALRGQTVDPVVAESRLKTMLASNPQADALYFTLGNEYAQQARWGEAREAYLRALAADPENPDFAYNVAVSLDHLGERQLALSYYRQALALAGRRAASFPASAAQERVQQLSH
jgi:tetratricopeptide (TPR) repeat protein